jgi:long-chain fatty acid transport protein
MKKALMCVGGLALSIALTSTVFAGAIDNKTNWSAEYIRTLNRNAATDYADIAMYNPAGTVKLSEGFTVNGSIQFLSKEYKNIINGTSYESDEPSYIPGIFGVYNRGKWSLFGAFSNVAGGGKVDFGQGDWTTIQGIGYLSNFYAPVSLPSQQLTGESFYLGYTLGGAYSLNDMFSFSVGIRYVDAHKEASGSVNYSGLPSPAIINYEQDGNGWGGIFGVNIAPNDKLNFAMRYEMKTSIDLDTKVIQDTTESFAALPAPLLTALGIVNGTSPPRDLPAIFAIGGSYWITPKLRSEINLTYYFNEDADWGGEEKLVDNGYDMGITFEYHFNDSLLASIGYMHTKLGVNPEDMLPENPELDADTIGAGIAYAFTEKFHTNFSIGNSFYKDDSFQPNPITTVKYEKNVSFVVLGVEYRFL